ncbi:MAG: 7TM-DISM domain-containing protein, partial [Methyloceanibacter sp.]
MARGKAVGCRDSRWAHLAALAVALCASLLLWPCSLAQAVDAIVVKPELEKIDVTALGELYEGRGDRLQIETAPGQDGFVGRVAVQATTPGTNPGWLVFALTNPTTDRITRWLVAPRYTLANSRAFWPELDAGRISAITPSLGFRPERMTSNRADMFRLSLEPGQTITFAAEMSSRQVPRLTLWDPDA